MKKQINKLGNLLAVATALFFLLALPALAGTAVGFDPNPVPRLDDSDKYKSIIEDADPVGSYWRGYYIPGAGRITFHIHSSEDRAFYLPNLFGRLPLFGWRISDQSVLDLFRGESTNGSAARNKRRD
jgi:hypothetical protein